jgi:hypothetical protein
MEPSRRSSHKGNVPSLPGFRPRIWSPRISQIETRSVCGLPRITVPGFPSLCHPERGRTPESKDPGTARADIADWSFRMEHRRVRAGLDKIEEVGLTGRSRWEISTPTWTNKSPQQKNSHLSRIGVLRLGRSPSLRMTTKRRFRITTKSWSRVPHSSRCSMSGEAFVVCNLAPCRAT